MGIPHYFNHAVPCKKIDYNLPTKGVKDTRRKHTEMSAMKLVYYHYLYYDVIIYKFNEQTLRKSPLSICFLKTLTYKLGLDSNKLILLHENTMK
jgi:hypothetical protein